MEYKGNDYFQKYSMNCRNNSRTNQKEDARSKQTIHSTIHTIDFPYRSPSAFYSYTRTWTQAQVMQPEMVLFPEKGVWSMRRMVRNL